MASCINGIGRERGIRHDSHKLRNCRATLQRRRHGSMRLILSAVWQYKEGRVELGSSPALLSCVPDEGSHDQVSSEQTEGGYKGRMVKGVAAGGGGWVSGGGGLGGRGGEEGGGGGEEGERREEGEGRRRRKEEEGGERKNRTFTKG